MTSSVKPAFTFYFLPRGKLNCISRVTESDHLYISWVNINQTIFEPPEFYQKFWHRCNFRHFSSNPIHKPSWIRTYLTNYMSELSKLFSVRAMYLRRIFWTAKSQNQTCNVGPHYAGEPSQEQEASHRSNICDKPCGTGENLKIHMDTKHFHLHQTLFMKCCIVLVQYYWIDIGWGIGQCEQNPRSFILHSQYLLAKSYTMRPPYCERSFAACTLNHEMVRVGKAEDIICLDRTWKANCQIVFPSVFSSAVKCSQVLKLEEKWKVDNLLTFARLSWLNLLLELKHVHFKSWQREHSNHAKTTWPAKLVWCLPESNMFLWSIHSQHVIKSVIFSSTMVRHYKCN